MSDEPEIRYIMFHDARTKMNTTREMTKEELAELLANEPTDDGN